MNRKILHIDLDAFFCAVEEQRNPDLRGKAFAVGGKPEQRGVVASCSYPARRFGVRSAMPMGQAMRLCPHLIIVPSTHRAYSDVSRKVMALLSRQTPFVEQLSIDEAFLDVTALSDPATTIAHNLQASIRQELGLPCSLGVATNKLVAKIANNVGKAMGREKNDGASPPNAIQVVPPGQEAAFLAPLPCSELWGVGPKTAERLRQLGMSTIGDIATWSEADLVQRFGKHGSDLARRAKGIDERPVVTERDAKSISQEITFAKDVQSEEKLKQTLLQLAEGVSKSLKRQELAGVTIKLKIRWSDFTTPTRQLTLDHPVNDTDEIYRAACKLFVRIWQDREPVRLLGIGVSGFDRQAHQMSLWDVKEAMEQEAKRSEKEVRLAQTLDELRAKFGEDIVQRAGKSGRGFGSG